VKLKRNNIENINEERTMINGMLISYFTFHRQSHLIYVPAHEPTLQELLVTDQVPVR